MALLCSCARFRSTQTESPDGTRTTRVTVTTFFDAHNDLAKLRTTMTDHSQGIGLSGLDQSTTSTNALEILRLVTALVGMAAK